MKNKATILIVDDIASNIQILATILNNEYQLKVATDGQRALELAIQEPLPDLILLDIEMPSMNGYEVLQRLRDIKEARDIPVIFVTANTTTENEEKGLILGAVDYITKPVKPVIVKARVNTQIVLKKQKDELIYIAFHDKLTGLYNRYYLMKAGESKFSRATRHNEKLSVIIGDIDNFKSVNDTYGHIYGDKVLKEIGALLNQNNRKEDFIARYGGEEFIIILEHCNASSAKEKAEKIREAISKLDIDGISVSASFGVAQIDTKNKSFDSLIKDADEALYIAKDSGRNKVVLFK